MALILANHDSMALSLVEMRGGRLLKSNASRSFSQDGVMNEHVLVVDDHRDTADGLARLIDSFGFRSRAVYSGEEAIQETAAFEPDMALVDLGMPGLDGIETVKRIRQQRGNAHIIIVAVTGWTRSEDKQRAYSSG